MNRSLESIQGPFRSRRFCRCRRDSILNPPTVDLDRIVVSSPPVVLLFVPARVSELGLEHFDMLDSGGTNWKIEGQHTTRRLSFARVDVFDNLDPC